MNDCGNISRVPMETAHYREKEALSRILASGEFSRAPNLERILVYLCQKSFDGEGGHVKEFHLATEVLGRPVTFDPKKDSIVRVEMHRLRKRLRDYYDRTPEEPVRILLPEKSYVPEFQFRDRLAQTEDGPFARVPTGEPTPALSQIAPVTQWEPAKPAAKRPFALMAVAGIAAVLSLAWIVLNNRGRAPELSASGTSGTSPLVAVSTTATAADPVVLPAVPAGPEIRILAGRPPGSYVDRYGKTWSGDLYYKGGEATTVNAEVRSRGWDANIFAGMREGDFSYEIPLAKGTYELTLIFAETAYGEGRPLGVESHRVFSILANGKPLVESLDVLVEALDPNTAWTRVFKDIHPDADGKLHLKFFRASGSKAFVNAILIRPGIPGKMLPLRMVARQQAYRDANDVLWEPDHYFHGGTQITRPHGAPAGDHFQGERFGYFSYEIPVAKGKYAARLYFWEYWWGANQPGKGGVGSRVFDVYCNHRPLLLDFDIIRRHPQDQTAIETFHGLEPDSRGVLAFDFVPKANYAMINAIEILDESK
ncbi:hypothetical protein F183_A21690 [Bryobacterales bacterium F-183]|nr:hypothetical protein F183_A21690 [Bryobacterales bacterium F-183]